MCEYLDFDYAKTDIGVYHAYTNIKDTFYEFLIAAYLSKYGHSENYYEKIKGTNFNNEKQILEYFAKDKTNVIEMEPDELDLLKKMRDNGFDSEIGLYQYIDAEFLVKQLSTFMYDAGTKKVTLEGASCIL